MTEEISVGYTHVPNTPSYHAIIMYTNNAGVTSYIQGQPQNSDLSFLLKVQIAIDSSLNNTPSEQGALIISDPMIVRPGVPINAGITFENLPTETIITGEDLSSQWEKIVKYGEYINYEKFAYLPEEQNSNTFVFKALEAAGLEAPTGYAIYPDDKNATPSEVNLEGSGGYFHIKMPTSIQQCFLPGAPILMADGSEKPIEDVNVGDEVLAFDGGADKGLGPKVPKKVTRLFRNMSQTIIDLHGLKMTPGHVVLSDNGEWLKIATVLKNDRAIVKENDGKPVLHRARTGAVVGSLEDIAVQVLYQDHSGQQHVARVRAGIPSIAQKMPNGHRLWTLAQVLTHQNYTISEDGAIIDGHGKGFDATPWPGSSPLETEMMLNWVVSVDGLQYTPKWIEDLSENEERQAVNQSDAFSPTTAGQFSPASKPLNRHQRRRLGSLRLVR